MDLYVKCYCQSDFNLFCVVSSLDYDVYGIEGETTEHDAIALTLLGPNENSRSGDYFMTEKFRKAYLEGTMQFRIFAESLQRDGLTIPIRLLDK